MTVKQIIETIQTYVPSVNETEVFLALNRYQRLFCRRTKILHGDVDLTLTTNTVKYNYPSTVESVDELVVLDSTEKAIDDTECKYVLRDSTITFIDSKGKILVSLPTDAATARLTVSKRPTSLSSLASTPDIDEEFQEVLWAMYLEEKMAAAGNGNVASYWRTVVKENERDAKIAATRRGDSGAITPVLARF